jgi:hypothetical protein
MEKSWSLKAGGFRFNTSRSTQYQTAVRRTTIAEKVGAQFTRERRRIALKINPPARKKP